jgi:hypothetical protein
MQYGCIQPKKEKQIHKKIRKSNVFLIAADIGNPSSSKAMSPKREQSTKRHHRSDHRS